MNIHFRDATIQDAKLLFEWRNDATTQAASINSSPIRFADHIHWLRESLASPTRKIFIAVVDNIPIGTIRTDRLDSGHELSWTIAPDWRGKGYGTSMVKQFIQGMKTAAIARVYEYNMASLNIIKRAGMTLIRNDDGLLYFKTDN